MHQRVDIWIQTHNCWVDDGGTFGNPSPSLLARITGYYLRRCCDANVKFIKGLLASELFGGKKSYISNIGHRLSASREPLIVGAGRISYYSIGRKQFHSIHCYSSVSLLGGRSVPVSVVLW